MRNIFSGKGLKFLILACLLSIALSLFSFFHLNTPLFQNVMGTIAVPFQSVITTVSNFFTNFSHHFADYTAIAEENEALRLEIAQIQEELRHSRADSEENERLRKLLGLQEKRRDFSLESAKIIRHSDTNWSATFTLNRGTSHDIQKGDCVISAEGYLIGIISEAGYNWSTVLTIIDTDAEIGAKLFRTEALAVAEGDFALMKETRLKLSYFNAETMPLTGDYIVTSGLGGYYPADIVIGRVESVRTDDSGMNRYAVLAPMVDFSELTQVFIIKDFDVVE